MFAERDFLDSTIGKGQCEVGLFVNCRGNGANVGIVSEDADQMRLLVLSYRRQPLPESWLKFFL